MARNINKIAVAGNVASDIEIKYTGQGTAVLNFTVATNESYKDKDGEYQERASFHRATAWGKAAEIIGEYVNKGDKIYIEGPMQYGSYTHKDHDDVEIPTSEIKVREFMLIGGQGGSGAPAEAKGDDELPY